MEMVLVVLTDDLLRQLDQGGLALQLLLDLTAAFEMVKHDLITHHVTDIQVHRVVIQWLPQFLWGQGQRIALGGRVSTRFPLLCGVLQGGLLSPVLFNIYVCPLAQLVWNFRLECHQYADNFQLYLLISGCPDTIPQNQAEGLE